MDIQKIDDFIKKLLEILIDEKQFDIIIPTARRGIEVLKLSPRYEELLNDGRIVLYESIFINLDYLKGKRIVIFDESVSTGSGFSTRRDALYSILSTMVSKPKIKTSALLINRSAKLVPDIYLEEMVCSDELYNHYSDELMYKILSNGEPLDVDHIIVPLDFSESQADFRAMAQKSKSMHELPHSRCFENIEMFTVEFNEEGYKIPKLWGGNLPLYEGCGPKKIRIFKSGNIVNIVPVLYPVMKIVDIKKSGGSCKIANNDLGLSLCKLLKGFGKVPENEKLNKNIKNRVCYNCLLMNLHLDFISYFLRDLHKNNVKFKINKINENFFRPFYPRFAKEITEKINTRLDHFTESLLQEFEPAPIISLPPLKVPTTYISDLEPYLINTGIGKLHENVNDSKFDHHLKDSTEEKSPGLTYTQIVDTASNIISTEEASQGMDVALDIGCLTPRTAYEGMRFNHPEEFIGICRIYSLTGEIKVSMNKFVPLIMQLED